MNNGSRERNMVQKQRGKLIKRWRSWKTFIEDDISGELFVIGRTN